MTPEHTSLLSILTENKLTYGYLGMVLLLRDNGCRARISGTGILMA